MKGTKLRELLKGTFVVPLGLLVLLMPYSMLLGWNSLTLILFWFILVPGLSIFLPTKASNSKSHFLESLFGLIIFYAFMVFMIYEHYKTDYFLLMAISGALNMIVVAMANSYFQPKPQKHID